MKLKIADNIRTFRKERKLTQEQLSEALGVTVGAVSKWESGSSMPDINLIVEMADFFETSVDVLLGYDWRSGGMAQALERIHTLRNEKRFDEATVEVEKALKKYPNAFEVVFKSAIVYSLKGVERRCQRSYQRALELFERSLELIAQNTNEKINEWTIRNHIAQIYLCMKRTDDALELLKKNNADGLNDGDIGDIYASVKHQPDEALPYLSNAMLDCFTKLHRTVQGYANAYADKRDHASALEIMLWLRGIVAGLRLPDKTSYLYKQETQLLTGCAQIAAAGGDEDKARRYLREALMLARRFDTDPDYGFTNTRFFHGDGCVTAFDDFGDTAMNGVARMLADDDKTAQRLGQIWEELQNE